MGERRLYVGLGAREPGVRQSETIEMAGGRTSISAARRCRSITSSATPARTTRTPSSPSSCHNAFSPIYTELEYAIPDEMRTAGQLNYALQAWGRRRAGRTRPRGPLLPALRRLRRSGWGQLPGKRDDEELTQRLTALGVPGELRPRQDPRLVRRACRARADAAESAGIFVDAEAGPAPMAMDERALLLAADLPGGRGGEHLACLSPRAGASVPALDDEIAAHCIDAGNHAGDDQGRQRADRGPDLSRLCADDRRNLEGVRSATSA